MNAVERLKVLHDECGCIVGTMDGRVTKQGTNCPLAIEGVEFALDCDKCRAFSGDPKPDLIAVHRCGEDYHWVVIEIANRIKAGAHKQIESGLNKIRTHELFKVDVGQATAYHASHKGGAHQADIGALRKPIPFKGQRVTPDTVRCSGAITCS